LNSKLLVHREGNPEFEVDSVSYLELSDDLHLINKDGRGDEVGDEGEDEQDK
jgi:hypothetical protein